MIVCSNVAYYYPNGQGIHDIHLTIEAGSTYLLAGMNGSGKSTLLKVLAGGLVHYSGSITVNGLDLRESQQKKKRVFTVALSPQQPETQFSLSTVLDELRFTANVTNRPVDIDMENELLDLLQIRSLVDMSPFDLTPVKRKLLSLAIAAVIPSPFIALDEPTAGIDREHKPLVLKFIKFLHTHNKGVIIVSHDLDTFLPASSHVGIMNGGTLIESDRTGTILKNFMHRGYDADTTRPFIIPRLARILTNKPASSIDEITGNIITRLKEK